MKKEIFYRCIGGSLLSALVLMACGQPQTEVGETSSVPTAEPVVTIAPAEPFTEAELRQAISELAEDATYLAQKQKYYERLLAMDVFGETDYVELARIYGDMGDWKGQRRMLFKLLRLYPTAEYAEMLSAVTVRQDESEEDMVLLAESIREALEQQDAMAIRSLALSEEWRRLLQEDMDAVETRTYYRSGEETFQVAAGGLTTDITWRDGQGRFLFYRGDESGAVIGSAFLVEGVYAGEVKVTYSDGEGTATRVVQGTLENDMCVGRLTITYQGVEYTGNFREDGTVAEEQLKEVTEQGGVIYAYGPGGKTYLYQENAEIQDFRIDPEFLGLPEYEEWR